MAKCNEVGSQLFFHAGVEILFFYLLRNLSKIYDIILNHYKIKCQVDFLHQYHPFLGHEYKS